MTGRKKNLDFMFLPKMLHFFCSFSAPLDPRAGLLSGYTPFVHTPFPPPPISTIMLLFQPFNCMVLAQSAMYNITFILDLNQVLQHVSQQLGTVANSPNLLVHNWSSLLLYCNAKDTVKRKIW